MQELERTIEILEELEDKNQNLEYVYEQIKKHNYTILPDTIAEGKVLKVHFKGTLEEEGYEKGFLILTKNSSIKEHKHIKDAEKYTLLKGNLSIHNEKQAENICLIGQKHCIDKVDELTIIKTIKVSKEIIKSHEKQFIKKYI